MGFSPILDAILGASGSMRAGNAINNAAIAAEHGLSGQHDINVQNVNAAVGAAQGGVNTAAGTANNTLQAAIQAGGGTYKPFIEAGQGGVNALSKYALSNPQFTGPQVGDLNEPGLKFQLQEGLNAIQNNAAATGTAASGNVLKAITQYGQGLANTYYNDAFNRSLARFQTNQNTTLSNLGTLAGFGLGAAGQYNLGMVTPLASRQAENTLGAAYYGGNVGIQGQEFLGTEGMNSALNQGKFAVEGANARALGILGSNASYLNAADEFGQGVAGAFGF